MRFNVTMTTGIKFTEEDDVNRLALIENKGIL